MIAPEISSYLQHVSAEINTACSEGFYVHIGVPDLYFSVAELRSIKLKDGTVISGVDVEDMDYDPSLGFKLNYHMVPLDQKRITRVDLRDEMSKRRSPEYQPPPGNLS